MHVLGISHHSDFSYLTALNWKGWGLGRNTYLPTLCYHCWNFNRERLTFQMELYAYSTSEGQFLRFQVISLFITKLHLSWIYHYLLHYNCCTLQIKLTVYLTFYSLKKKKKKKKKNYWWKLRKANIILKEKSLKTGAAWLQGLLYRCANQNSVVLVKQIDQWNRRERQELDPSKYSHPREGNGNPLQYSCLEISMDGRA